MSFVTSVITPIFQMIVYVFMVVGVCWLSYKGIKKSFPNLNWTLKYRLFARKFNEGDVAWCMDAYEKGLTAVDVKKFLLIKGRSPKRTSEIVYIFHEIQKRMKGGDANDRKFGQSHGQDQENQTIPSIPT